MKSPVLKCPIITFKKETEFPTTRKPHVLYRFALMGRGGGGDHPIAEQGSGSLPEHLTMWILTLLHSPADKLADN